MKKKVVIIGSIILCLIISCFFVIKKCDKEEQSIKTTIYSSYIKGYENKEDSDFLLVEPFGTYISFIGYKEKDVKELQDELDEMVTKYHSLLDRNYYYKDNQGNIINNIKVINDSYGSNEAIVVDEIIIEILKAGVEYTKLSEGSFNIISGSIVDVWDERFNLTSKYHVDPTNQEIDDAMKCVASFDVIDQVLQIDDVNKTIKFNKFGSCNNGASITLGALAKSYFLDKLSSLDKFKDIGASIYDAGQSSIIVRGDNPVRDGGVWNVAIRDSFNKGYVVQLRVKEFGSISTSSGDNKGYVNEQGIRRHHIIDASNGQPNTYLLAATVVCDSAMIADIVTTTLMTKDNLNDIKNYLSKLENNDIELKVLLQIEDNDSLKVLVNDSMNKIAFDVSDKENNVIFEVFNYGA